MYRRIYEYKERSKNRSLKFVWREVNFLAEKKKGNIASRVADMIKDAVEECGCVLWDVEFVKEGTDFNLIVYIDRPEGISLDDCEMVNDAIEPIIDENDPIEGSYFLEVSSPGLERELKNPMHVSAFVGERVLVKLFAPKDGKKAFDGNISSYNEETDELVLDCSGTEIVLSRKDCASIKTVCEF